MKFLLLCREFSRDSKLRDAVTSEVALTASTLSSAGKDVVILTGRTSPEQKDSEQIDPSTSVIRMVEHDIINPFRYTKLMNTIAELRCDVAVTYLSFMLFPKFGKIFDRLHVNAFHRLIHGSLSLADTSHAMLDLVLRYPLIYRRIDLYDLARLLYPTSLLQATFKKNTSGTVITQSDKTRIGLLKAGFYNQKVMTIRPAIAPIWFKNVQKTRIPHEYSNSPKRILYYGGGPSIFRGIDTLVRSIAHMKNPTVHLEVYLRGSDKRDEKMIRNLARKLDLSSQIQIVTGFQETDFLVSRVLESNCVVLPFKFMGKVADIPLTVIEPMACGRPVISTRVGAIPEVVEHDVNGLLVAPSSTEQLSGAIEEILQNDSLCARISANARESARAYRSDSIIEKLLDIYQN